MAGSTTDMPAARASVADELRYRSMGPWPILGLAFIALLAGHLLLSEYMSSPAIGVLGFLVLAAVFGYALLARNDPFAFLMVIYVCSHFSYANNQGGLWALMAGVLVLARIPFRLRSEAPDRGDAWVMTCLGVLIVWDLVGLAVRSPMGYVERFEAAVSFAGFLMCFYLMSKVVITPARFRTFLVITTVLFVYQFVVAINQRYAFVNWNTPLIGAYHEGTGAITYGSTNAAGTFRHSELFGEYGALFWTLLIPVLCSSSTQREVRYGTTGLVVSMTLALIFIAITSTRSAALLAGTALVIYFFLLTAFSFKTIDRFGRQLRLGIALAALIPFIGAYVGFGSLEQNFSELHSTHFTSTSVFSGQALNRGNLFEIALARIEHGSWLVGYGLGTPRSNIIAWTGIDPAEMQTVSDFHNLYLSLPFLFGWPGTIAFIWLIVMTGLRAWRAALRNARRRSFLVAASLGFAVFWFVFLVDQYKISVLRLPSYHMLFWIWLGMTTAVVRTLALERAVARQEAAVETSAAAVEDDEAAEDETSNG